MEKERKPPPSKAAHIVFMTLRERENARELSYLLPNDYLVTSEVSWRVTSAHQGPGAATQRGALAERTQQMQSCFQELSHDLWVTISVAIFNILHGAWETPAPRERRAMRLSEVKALRIGQGRPLMFDLFQFVRSLFFLYRGSIGERSRQHIRRFFGIFWLIIC